MIHQNGVTELATTNRAVWTADGNDTLQQCEGACSRPHSHLLTHSLHQSLEQDQKPTALDQKIPVWVDEVKYAQNCDRQNLSNMEPSPIHRQQLTVIMSKGPEGVSKVVAGTYKARQEAEVVLNQHPQVPNRSTTCT